MRAARFRPSLLPDHFAGLPVLLSPLAVRHEFPEAEDRLGIDWTFHEEDMLLGPDLLRDRLLRPMEATLYPSIQDHLDRATPVAVTFEVAPPSVVILVWAVPTSPSNRLRRDVAEAVPETEPSRVHQRVFRSPTGRVTEVLTRSWS